MTLVLVSLGGNVGDVVAAFHSANRALRETPGIEHLRSSPLFRSAPMGQAAGATFWNAVTAFETSLDAHALLDALQLIENQNERTREIHWGPRTLDLDLVLFGDQVIHTERLQVPHPHFFYRRFVVEPAASIVPDMVDPLSGQSMGDLLERLSQRPIRFVLGNGINVDVIRREFRREFSHAEFESQLTSEFDSPARSNSEFAFGIIHGSMAASAVESRFWIPLIGNNPLDEIRSILQAACGKIELGESDQ